MATVGVAGNSGNIISDLMLYPNRRVLRALPLKERYDILEFANMILENLTE